MPNNTAQMSLESLEMLGSSIIDFLVQIFHKAICAAGQQSNNEVCRRRLRCIPATVTSLEHFSSKFGITSSEAYGSKDENFTSVNNEGD